MKINAGEIRVGMLLEYKNDLWQVLKTQHVKPGKGGAFAQVEMKSLNKNTKLNERFRSSETVEKASLEETKYLLTSVGAARGCFFSNLYLKPSSNDPFEKATLANLALDIEILSPSLDRNNSIIFFEAPIKLTGIAALSVETQKYFMEL